MASITKLFRRGINLGNTLDAFKPGVADMETSWGNPHTTQEMIQMYADAGFDTLRLPVTWGPHMGGAPDYTIDPKWMARVREVVSWGLQAGMSVILNAHHENSWTLPELSNLCDVLPRYRSLWRQIADEFADIGDKLVFQGLNEPRIEGPVWDCGTPGNRAAVNALNHTFVRTVREAGGNNATRWLCIPGVAARIEPDSMKDMIMPEDDHLIFTIHSYVPERFAFAHGSPEDTEIFDESARNDILKAFADIKTYAVPHGVPIMMTEFGAVTKLMPDGKTTNDAERIKFLEVYNQCADELDIPLVWWDNNYHDHGDEYFALFDRDTLTCLAPEVVSALVGDNKAGGKL